jgi:hypothetical protein
LGERIKVKGNTLILNLLSRGGTRDYKPSREKG